ncbi:MAG: C40 family peptidase [Thermodesulfobacteriota bacterium]
MALALGLAFGSGCGAARRVSIPSPRPVEPVQEEHLGDKVARMAKAYVGVPYRYGGESPQGFDCSGLTYYVYGRYGYSLPRSADEQVRVGRWVPRKELQPGDLVFFRVPWNKSYHVGIFMGRGRFIHAPRTGKRVEVQSLDQGYYQHNYYTARRIINEG